MRRTLVVFVISSVAAAQPSSAQSPTPCTADEHAERAVWNERIASDIQQGEYRYRAVAVERGVWSAPNRSLELRSRVSTDGLEAFPRRTSADGLGADWKLTLATTSFGRRGDVQGLYVPSISTNANRIELDHGPLVEWFTNDERGIEQGWTIAERPRGVEPLWIGLEFGGDLSLRIDERGRSGKLVDACGELKLRYRDLVVFDTTGRELDARIESSSIGVGIRVDDRNAIYPVTVDPVLTGPAWTAESNQAGARLGESVASAGDVNADGFSDVVVGAPSYDNGELNEGRAFLYLGSSTGLATSAAWTVESNQANAAFGDSVATAGDVNGDGFSDVLVGAYQYDNGESNEGRAFLYLGSGAGLSTSAAWTAESDEIEAWFGRELATAGDVNGDGYSDVIVSAYQYDNGETDEGRAYVFTGSSVGLTTGAVWTVESDQASAFFGIGVASAGDVNGDGYGDVIVGAETYTNGQSSEGRAYVYLGSGAGLSTGAAWTAEGNQVSAFFGNEVATAGDVNGDGFSDVLVGSFFFDNGETDEGRAFLYLGSSTGLGNTAAWTAEGNQTNGYFGRTLATAGDVNGDGYSDVIVGSEHYDNGETDEGGAFVYLGSALGVAASSAWTLESDQVSARLGSSVATAGDVNGDGFSDAIIGAPLYDNGQADEGRAFVFLGSASGLATSAAWTAESDQANAQFGVSVATAGDVNGDGYCDVIVGASNYANGQSAEGRAYVYLGSSTGLSISAAWTAESDQANALYGESVGAAGDVNGDGYADVIIGAAVYDNGEFNEGRAFVYSGSIAGLSTSATWTAEGNQIDAQFGICVGTAGDVDADGYSDVIVGASFYDNGETDEGRAFVYLGSGAGLSSSASWTAESDQAGASFGRSVATAGDVNGDGFSDVIVGAYVFDNGESDEGRAYSYLGSSSGLSTSPAWTAESNQIVSRFGSTVAPAGDVNGDGYSDVIVGAFFYDNGETDEGRAYVYLGSGSGLASSAAWTAEGNQSSAHFGYSVATAGDVNGDGYSDVIVGARLYDAGETDEGRALVFLGNDGRGGWTRAPQQRRSSDSAPIGLLGRSLDKFEFRIRLAFERELAGFASASGLTPKARLEWEVAPQSAPLDGSRIDSGAEQTITGLPLVFNELAEFVSPGPFQLPLGVGHHVAAGTYHWHARVRTNNPLFPVTPWVSIPWNNVTETKLRVRSLPTDRVLH